MVIRGLEETLSDVDAMMKDFRNTLSVIRENGSVDGNGGFDNVSKIDNSLQNVDRTTIQENDLQILKATAKRLNLATRRPSYQAWRAQYIEKPVPKLDRKPSQEEDGRLTVERKERINNALEWLRDELADMRSQDEALARQLLSLRQDIYKLKLKRSCEEHQEMMDDVKLDLEEIDELHQICDLPFEKLYDNPLKHLGVTRMNINDRRFSLS